MTDLRQPYLTSQLIAYIGNKRSLLPFIHEVLADFVSGGARTFLDPFAGSGGVSRLARAMGLRVFANDWEPYTQRINGCHLGVDARELCELFADRGGIDSVLTSLNSLGEPSPADRYISRFYAPRVTATADYRTERLFYTAENARRIDAIRSCIEDWYPGPVRGLDSAPAAREAKEKTVLIAALLYQAATHTNTSGVFKACHKGFGGHSGDALSRIMAPIRLLRPIVIDAAWRGEVSCMESRDFVSGRSADICYLDPPYNQHQYGSNYHLLNTIGLWDHPAVNNDLGPDGRLVQKAGIRKDWVRTKSDFCTRSGAAAALDDLLEQIDCPLIVLSYNSDGVVKHEELVDILSRQGRVTIRSSGYLKYRGGRQSVARQAHNAEQLWIVDRRRRTSRSDLRDVDRALRRQRLALMAKARFDPQRVRRIFAHDEHVVWLGPGLPAPMPWHYRFADPSAVADLVPESRVADILASLASCVCGDRAEQIDVLLTLLDQPLTDRDWRVYSRELVRQLRKLAHPKYTQIFSEYCERIAARAERDPRRFGSLDSEMGQLSQLAAQRAGG